MRANLRALERRDLPELVQLCQEHAAFERTAWQDFEREDRLAELFLDSSSARCWVVEGSGELAGFASATLERSTWDAGHFLHLDCLFLREAYRGQGLGRALMVQVADTALELGALNLQWQTPSWNGDAVRFYERLGASSSEKLRFTMTPADYERLAEDAEPGPAAMAEPASSSVAAPRSSSQRLARAAAALVILLWASSFVGVKLALAELAPGPLALARYALASLAFVALLAIRRCALPRRADLVRLAAAGLLGITLYNLALNAGQRSVGAGVASLLVNTVPLWTSLLAMVLLKERLSPRGWVGALVSFSGVALISASKGGLAAPSTDFLLVLAAALSQAAYFVLIKPLLARYHPIDLTSYVIWFGSLFLLPFHDGLWERLSSSSPETQAAVLFLGLGPAALAYLAWAYVLSKLPAGRASNLLFLVPVVAIALAWGVLEERPAPLALIGGGIAILGVLLNRRASVS